MRGATMINTGMMKNARSLRALDQEIQIDAHLSGHWFWLKSLDATLTEDISRQKWTTGHGI